MVYTNSTFEITINPIEPELQKSVALRLGEIMRHNQKGGILLLFSGGSALKFLDNIDSSLITQQTTISMLDDRFSTNPHVNNYLQFSQTGFFETAQKKGASFIKTVPLPEESLSAFAERIEQVLREWRRQYPKGVVIITQGIGADGHTAGIMPYPENSQHFKNLFYTNDRWVIGYDATPKNEHPLRITVTMLFLKYMVDYALVYLAGVEKRQALLRIISFKGSVEETPARILRSMRHVELFTTLPISKHQFA